MANQNEWATITVENIAAVLTKRFATGVPGEGLTLSCHEAHMLMAYFQCEPDAKDAIPPGPEGATAPALDEVRRSAAQRLRYASTRAHRHAAGRRDTVGRHRAMWHECQHPDCVQDRTAADALEPFAEADASPVKEER